MSAPARHLILAGLAGLGLSLGLLLGGGDPAGARARAHKARPHTVDARVSAAFVMHGRIRAAVRVKGEHRGQRISRRWTFSGRACSRNICRRLLLARERSAHQVDYLVLHRVGTGRYAGRGRFYAALECRGAIYPRGQVAPYRVTVRITDTKRVHRIRFATALAATYTNRRRFDHTICPTGPSHDAATYAGTASPPPSPPTAAFTSSVAPGTATATFTSTSAPGGDQAPLTAFRWRFGDPRSGAANTATTAQAGHTFTAPGTYRVSLTVTDASGLTARRSERVVVPAPPG